MKISDIMKDDGLFGILSEDDDAEEGKKKHKKSKDKGKKKSKDRSVEYETANARLKEMSKGELRLRCQEYGVKGSEADFNSKKSMRHAILRAMGLKKSGPVMPLTIHDQISTPTQGPVRLNPDATLEELVKERPPYYFDENTGDFVFAQAKTQSAMTCLDGFMAMGHIRKQADPEDGFAELAERLYAKITAPAAPALEESPKEDVIPVKDYKVLDEVAEPPAELSAEDAAKLTAKVDDMLKGATSARKKREKAVKD